MVWYFTMPLWRCLNASCIKPEPVVNGVWFGWNEIHCYWFPQEPVLDLVNISFEKHSML